MAEQGTQSIVAAQSLIESKLTKTEAIELIVADALKDLRRARTNLEAEIKRLEQVSGSDVIELFRDVDATLSIWDRKDDVVEINFKHNSFKSAKLSAMLKERVAKIRALQKQKDEICENIHRLESDRQATKVGILKSILEGSPEGRAMLAQLDALRHQAAKRLGVEVDVRLLAGKA